MPMRLVKLAEFLSLKNVPQSKVMPLVHTTESSRLPSILNAKAIMAMPCNIFHGEKLCYLFVGRPAYKYTMPGEATYWTLPTVIVMRFGATQPALKRIYPFDSGAFTSRRLPDYITVFERDDFEFGPDFTKISTLISVFFGDEKRYWRRQASAEKDFKDKYSLGPLHMQLEALNKISLEHSMQNFMPLMKRKI